MDLDSGGRSHLIKEQLELAGRRERNENIVLGHQHLLAALDVGRDSPSASKLTTD
jgi:hypothetical protein